jgi:PleD family two-component response regulator
MNETADISRQTSEAMRGYRISVLLVDDQPMIAEAVRRGLASDTDIGCTTQHLTGMAMAESGPR